MSYVERLFRDFPLERFLGEYLHRLPFALPGAAESVAELGTWGTLGRMLRSPGIRAMWVRQGAWYEGPEPADADAAQALAAEGWTAIVRHAEQHDEGIGRLARDFRQTFRAEIDVHMFFTPPGQRGFTWHYDAEDVFILQTAGEKHYYLRKNTVQPWPLPETLPADMQYEREIMPLSSVVLKAGDWLYVPNGYWHRAETPRGAGETAISLAVGVASRAAIDLLALLRPRLVESMVWRQRLPLGPRGEVTEHYRTLLGTLADDLARTLRDPAVADDLVRQIVGGDTAG
ncbi:MAG TPA: cupin domain-containing protein [Lacipirellulaceae bacterium]|nr:cupin domain-containing protein [Lacipirellulaceae bacterium]